MALLTDETREWLEADGLGGFASGTVAGVRTRRYHALLLAATTPPTGRIVLVNGFDAWLQTAGGQQALTTQRYAPGRPLPRRRCRTSRPSTPTRGRAGAIASPTAPSSSRRSSSRTAAPPWCCAGGCSNAGGRRDAARCGRSSRGRDYHALHHENPALPLRRRRSTASSASFASLRRRAARCTRSRNGGYAHEPTGTATSSTPRSGSAASTAVEDLASPGVLSLGSRRAARRSWILAADGASGAGRRRRATASRRSLGAREERRRRRFRLAPAPRRRRLPRAPRRRPDDHRRLSLVHRLGPRHVHRPARPLPGDRPARRRAAHPARLGRRGLARACCPTASPIAARRRSSTRSTPRSGSSSPSTSILAAAAGRRRRRRAHACAPPSRRSSTATPRGTRFGIRADDDGLLAAGEPGVQLTWMDAQVGDWVVTPRIGKPVEVQALWLNALWAAAQWAPRFARAAGARPRRASRRASGTRPRGCLFDVVDVDHAPGSDDATVRPNQILAVGGLPLALLDGERAAARRRRGRGAACRRRSACARSRPTSPATRGRYEGDGRSATALPPGHRVAVAARPVRRGLGARPRRQRRQRSARRASASSRRCSRTSTRPASATSPRSPTATRRTRPAAAPSRPGRSASCCGSIGWCWRSSRSSARRLPLPSARVTITDWRAALPRGWQRGR